MLNLSLGLDTSNFTCTKEAFFFFNPNPGMAVVTALTHAEVLLVLHI